jgi:hypothetical protein
MPVRYYGSAINRKRFYVRGHHNKEQAYIKALIKHGYIFTGTLRTNIGFVFYDHDLGKRWSILQRAHNKRIPLFLYPHAARPNLTWDGPFTPFSHFRCQFMISETHRKIMEIIKYPCPMEVVGWSMCDVLPFRPTKKVEKILFAPIHSNSNGTMGEVDKDVNRRAFERVKDYSDKIGAHLKVRHIWELWKSGLQYADGVEYEQGQPDNSYDDIEWADLVVSHQTFQWLSTARGKPTIGMGEDVPSHTIVENELRYVENWDLYKDLLMYPLDILSVPPEDVGKLVERVCSTDEDIRDWKNRFMGLPFDGDDFVKKLEKYL